MWIESFKNVLYLINNYAKLIKLKTIKCKSMGPLGRTASFQMIGSIQEAKQNYTVKILEGPQMFRYLEELAKMEVLYEEWPYLCLANLADDIESIRRIMNLGGVACVAFDNCGKIIGVAMGRSQELVSCVKNAFPEETRVFHMQHWLVKPERRNKKIASTLYTTLENHIRASRLYDRISCAIVIRSADFRLPKPLDAFSLEASFEKRGFTRFKPEIPFFFTWTLIDDSSDTKHPMALWMKDLTSENVLVGFEKIP